MPTDDARRAEPVTGRQLTFARAINEAIDLCMQADARVHVLGLGASDPKGIFGTTLGLAGKYGPERVLDMPTSENGMTGAAIGSALVGMRPILTHQRLDFALLAVDQLVNQAAKWRYMFGGQMRIPLVIRVVVGRGWGQGPQHSQSLQAWFAHVPGLKVVMPATAYDAKGLLVASVEDDNPVVFIEHRWLHNTLGDVPPERYRVPLGRAAIVRQGRDLTIAAVSYMVIEALQAASVLAEAGIDTEVIDVRTLRPLDSALILESVQKTGRLIVADTGWKTCGFGAEVVALVAEHAWDALQAPPRRVGLADCPTPTSPALLPLCYPQPADLIALAQEVLGLAVKRPDLPREPAVAPMDVPDGNFSGPF